jgi:hypothetical protein
MSSAAASPSAAAPAGGWGRPSAAALAALLCGFGLAAAGLTLIRAAESLGLLDALRGSRLPSVAEPVRSAPGTVQRSAEPVLPAGKQDLAPPRPDVPRQARTGFAAANARVQARLRACQQTCAATASPAGSPGQGGRAAPGRTVSARNGASDAGLATASLVRAGHPSSCRCGGGGDIGRSLPGAADPTLRTGAVAVPAKEKARVPAATGRAAPRAQGFAHVRPGQVPSRGDATPRRAERRDTAGLEGAFTEVLPPAGSAAGVRAFQVRPDAGRPDPSGARIIVVR